jgi:urate oxidase
MVNIEIVQTLMYTIGLLIIMVYPAMRIADYLSSKIEINQALDDKLTIILTILLSFILAILLNYT